MAMTLVEAAKSADNPMASAIIEQYARSSTVLLALPFMEVGGNAWSYNREETLPGVGFRGVNEAYTEDVGVLNPITETLAIVGGDLDVDMFILKTQGEDQRSVREMMKVKALAHRFTKAFFKGDSQTDAREFDGLQARLTGSQKISAGSTSGGTALSLAKLDELIDAVDGANALFMNRAMRRRLSAAARNTSVGGYITTTLDAFGREVMAYNNLPIYVVDQDNSGTEILQFNEAAASGASTATSIYCVGFGETALTGIQNGGIDVRDLGELEEKPAKRTRVEWYAGIALQTSKCAARLWSIADAAVTA